MELRDALKPETTLLSDAATKPDVLAELADALSPVVGVPADSLLAAALRREALMSTGIGQGLAVPHARLPGVRRVAAGLAACKTGLADYASLDDQPVRIVVFIIAPQGQHEAYIRLLAAVTDRLKHQPLREAVLAAESPGDVYQLLTKEPQ